MADLSGIVVPSRTPPRPARRKFGTVLSANSPPRSSVKKGKARSRLLHHKLAIDATSASTSTQGSEYTVVFEAGPIGLQLEPVVVAAGLQSSSLECYCRVQRFVDGGPKAPGAARKSGKIRPGDLVISVNGHAVSSYDAALQEILKDSSSGQRTITFKSAWTQFGLLSPGSPRRLMVPPKTPRVPGTAKRTPLPVSQKKIKAMSPSTPLVSTKQSETAAAATTMADSDDFEGDVSFMTIQDHSQDTILLSHIVANLDNNKSPPRTPSTTKALPSAALLSVEPKTPPPVTAVLAPTPTYAEHALSPSKVKQMVVAAAAASVATTPVAKATKSAVSTRVLKTVYKSVVPTAGSVVVSGAGVVASGSYALGSILSSKLGEALVGHSSKEFESTVELKMKLLQELSQAKVTVNAQQATIQTLLRDREVERDRLESELESTRQAKQVAEDGLQAEKNRAIQLESPDIGSAVIQAELEAVKVSRGKLEIELRRLQEQLKSQVESKESVEQTQVLLQDARMALEKKSAALEQTQRELESLQVGSSEQNATLRDANTRLQERLDETEQELQRSVTATVQSSLHLEQLELSKHAIERELRSVTEAAGESDQGESFRGENEALSQRLEVVEQDLVTARATTSRAESRLDELELSKKALQQELQSKTDSYAMLGDQASRSTTAIRGLLESRDAALKLSEATIQDLRLELNVSQGGLLEVEKLKSELSQARSANDALREDKDSLSSEEELRTRSSLNKALADLAAEKTSSTVLQRRVSAQELDRNGTEEDIQGLRREVTEALSGLDSRRAQNTRLSADLAQAEANLEAAANMLDTLEDEKGELIVREAKLRTELEKRTQSLLSSTSSASDAELVEARSEIAELNRQIRALESSKALAQREIEYLSLSNDKMSSMVHELRTTVEEQQGKLSANAVALMASTTALEDVQATMREKQGELDQSESALEKVQSQYLFLSQRLSRVAEESAREKDSMASDLINARDEFSETKVRNLELERLLRSMRRTVSDSEERAAVIRDQLLRERESRNGLVLSADNSKAKLEEKIVILSKESKENRDLVVGLKKELDQMRDDNASMEREIHVLTNAGSISRGAFERKETELKRERDELASLLSDERGKAVELSSKLRNAASDTEQANGEVEMLRRRCEEQTRLTSEDADTKSRNQVELLKTKEVALRDLHQSRQDLQVARTDVSRLDESLRLSRTEVDSLSQLLENVKSESNAKTTEISKRHAAKVALLAEEKEELECRFRRAEDQAEKLGSQLYDAEEGLMNSQTERESLLNEMNDLSSALHIAEDALAELELRAPRNERDLSSDEAFDGEFADLSRSELKAKCTSLQDELNEATSDVEASKGDVAQRTRHVRRLEEDLAMMSEEISKLVEVNGHFERRLNEIKSGREVADAEASSLRFKADETNKVSMGLEDRLAVQQRSNESLTDEVKSLKTEIDRSHHISRDREEELQRDLTSLEQLMSKAGQEKEAAIEDSVRMQDELDAVVKQKMGSVTRLSALETTTSELRLKLSDVEHERDALKKGAGIQGERYSGEMDALTTECATLRSRLSALEAECESTLVDLGVKEESELALSEQLETLRSDTLEKEKTHLEVASKLAQASRVVDSQKELILALETRALEAERTTSLLSDQSKKLQGTVKKLESSSDASGNIRTKQLQELEKKCSMLDEERTKVRFEASSLRDELRASRRQATEYKQKNDSLQSRIDFLKATLDQAKSQLHEARSARVNTTASSHTLENELDSKQMEVDHLKAKIQVLNATSARLKSDYLLLQDAALQAEFKNAANQDKSEEISRLKSELHTKSCKLDSLSEVYKSQRQVLALSQSLEEQLLRFIEDVIGHAEKVFSKISDKSFHLEQVGSRAVPKYDIEALDLAELNQPKPSLSQVRSGLDDLTSVIPVAFAALSEKRAQLKAWKERRSVRLSPPADGTPKSKSQAEEAVSPTVLGAFQQMKRVLNEEVFSPGKARRADASKLDADYFHRVIHSLESQIDALLADLKSANDALKAKDQMFVDLERLVSHHETERDLLENKLASMNQLAHEMEERLSLQSSWKEAAEEEIVALSRGLDSVETAISNQDGQAAAKQAAGQLIAKTLENRNVATKAACFRRWSNTTCAMQAVAQQGYVADELALQLENTREKLVILKSHLKKSRRSGRDNSGLDRIIEGYETT